MPVLLSHQCQQLAGIFDFGRKMSNLRATGADTATTRADIAEMHQFEHWPIRWIWPMAAALVGLQLLAARQSQECWLLLLAICPAISAIMFIFVLSFHDASHGRLYPLDWLNELHGHLVGTFSLTPLAVYRYAHARHHAQLGHERHPEFWPINSPGVARPLRQAAAEILLAVVYTPLLFLRSVVVGDVSPRERRLIIHGYVICAATWAAIFFALNYFALWHEFVFTSIVPMTISGTLQTLNKFEQYVGLHGETILGLTRTVVDVHPATELVSVAMLFNDYHGTHHRYAKIPYYHLPHATPYTLAGAREHCPVFPSVLCVTLDMLRCLTDPKVGPQWLEHVANGAKSQRGTIREMTQPVYTGEYAA
jgi:fatty acid desaturase